MPLARWVLALSWIISTQPGYGKSPGMIGMVAGNELPAVEHRYRTPQQENLTAGTLPKKQRGGRDGLKKNLYNKNLSPDQREGDFVNLL